jgi:ribosomal protein L29
MSIATASRSLSRLRTGLPLASRLRQALVLLALAFLLPFTTASAEGIAVTTAAIESGEDGLQLNADFDLQISQRLEEAVTRGVPLYFVVEFELSRPRWYWFDEKPVKLSQTYKITYTPLLRQYRLSVGNLYQNFTRFDEVKRVLARVRGWHVADKGAFKKEGVYQANLRMRLDTGQLPKPFQLNAVASTDWALSSEWHRWTITP